jgi:WD40 repeat protein
MPAESELSEIVYDGSRFAAFFCDTIAAHPSLVTLSALPFAPVVSKVYQLFYQGRADLPSVLGGYQQLWSPSFRVLHIPRIHVNSLAFSEDGSKIAASVSQAPMFNFEPNVSHSLHIWDVSTGTEDVAAAATDGGCVVAFAENGKKLLSASQTGALATLNTETGKVTLLDWTHFPSNADPPVIPRKERSSTFEEATKTVKDSMEERKHTSALDLMDSRVHHGTTQADHHHKTHNHYIVRAAFSPNGSTVVLGSQDGTLRVIDIAKGKELFPQVADMPLDSRAGLRLRMFHSISFSPDGLRFASASGDGGINVRDAKTGQLVFPKLEGHTGEVTALKFLTDMILSSAEADLSIRAWNAVTGTAMVLPAIIHSTDDFQPLDFSPDGRSLASTSKEGTIHIWDTALGKDLGPVLQGHFNQVSSVAFSSDAAKLVSGAFINPLQVWDVSHVRNYTSGMDRMKRAPHTIKFSPDGLLVESRRPEELKFWDTVTGKGLDLKAHSLSARFANEGSNVVLPPDSTPIGLLDSQRSEWHKPVESDHVSHLASSPKPETAKAITCSDEGIVSVSGKAVWRLPLELKHRCCAIRNNYIAFGTWDCHVFVVHLPDYLLYQ